LLGALIHLSLFGQVTINAPSGNGESNYKWYDASSGSEVVIGGETNSSLSTSTAGVYLATYDVDGCGGATEYFVLKTDCTDPSVTLDMGADNGGTTNQWYTDPASPTPLSGETGTTITLNATTTTTTYFMRATTGDCVHDMPAFTVLSTVECGCASASIYYAMTDGNSNTTGYQWDGSADNVSTQQYGLHRSTDYCEDGTWRHYYNTNEPDKFVFSIEMLTNTTEIDYIDIRLAQNPADRFSYISSNGAFAMPRDWHVETVGGASLTSPVNIRFYYPPNELKSMLDSSIAIANAQNLAVPTAADIVWFKKDNFDPSTDIDPLGSNLQNGANYQTLTPVVAPDANGVASTESSSIGNSSNYIQFDGLTDFSGGSGYVLVTPPLPVELSAFTVTEKDCKATIEWKSESEVNFSHYELQWSPNASSYSTFATIKGKGFFNSKVYQHNFEDLKNENYFRLKMVDLDGTFEYSNVAFLKASCFQSRALVFPNPILKDGYKLLNVRVNSPIKALKLEVYDAVGKLVDVHQMDGVDNTQSLEINISDYEVGIYFIRIEGLNSSTRFIVVE